MLHAGCFGQKSQGMKAFMGYTEIPVSVVLRYDPEPVSVLRSLRRADATQPRCVPDLSF